MVGANTENFRRRQSSGAAQLPIPRIILRNSEGSGISSFNNDPVSWFQEVFVRFPDTATELMSPSSEPLLELAWCRLALKDRLRKPSTRFRITRRWSFPDDSVIKYGSDMGGGNQYGPGGLLTRRSKWEVIPADGQLAVPTRIELEHYYRREEIAWWVGPAYSDRAVDFCLKPTFLKRARQRQPFSNGVVLPETRLPKYHGLEHGYFSFAFSVKDPNGSHPGDRITGPMAPPIRVIVCNADRSFPIRYDALGFPSFVGGTHLKMEFV